MLTPFLPRRITGRSESRPAGQCPPMATSPPRTNPSHQQAKAMRRVRARRRIPLCSGASLSEDLRFDGVGGSPAPCVSVSSRNFRGYESASAWITLSVMDQPLCHRLMASPKLGRSRPTTATATPATSRLVHLQVVGRKQMAVAADSGYGHGLEDTFRRKARHMSFGCFKARPRYHFLSH